MTNELAIRIITGDVLGTSEQTHEAIKMAVKALSLPSAQPEIIHCKDCKHHIDGRCLVANHHTVDHECCAEVFGAERKEDAPN